MMKKSQHEVKFVYTLMFISLGASIVLALNLGAVHGKADFIRLATGLAAGITLISAFWARDLRVFSDLGEALPTGFDLKRIQQEARTAREALLSIVQKLKLDHSGSIKDIRTRVNGKIDQLLQQIVDYPRPQMLRRRSCLSKLIMGPILSRSRRASKGFRRAEQEASALRVENASLCEKNASLAQEVNTLQQSLSTLEESRRREIHAVRVQERDTASKNLATEKEQFEAKLKKLLEQSSQYKNELEESQNRLRLLRGEEVTTIGMLAAELRKLHRLLDESRLASSSDLSFDFGSFRGIAAGLSQISRIFAEALAANARDAAANNLTRNEQQSKFEKAVKDSAALAQELEDTRTQLRTAREHCSSAIMQISSLTLEIEEHKRHLAQVKEEVRQISSKLESLSLFSLALELPALAEDIDAAARRLVAFLRANGDERLANYALMRTTMVHGAEVVSALVVKAFSLEPSRALVTVAERLVTDEGFLGMLGMLDDAALGVVINAAHPARFAAALMAHTEGDLNEQRLEVFTLLDTLAKLAPHSDAPGKLLANLQAGSQVESQPGGSYGAKLVSLFTEEVQSLPQDEKRHYTRLIIMLVESAIAVRSSFFHELSGDWKNDLVQDFSEQTLTSLLGEIFTNPQASEDLLQNEMLLFFAATVLPPESIACLATLLRHDVKLSSLVLLGPGNEASPTAYLWTPPAVLESIFQAAYDGEIDLSIVHLKEALERWDVSSELLRKEQPYRWSLAALAGLERSKSQASENAQYVQSALRDLFVRHFSQMSETDRSNQQFGAIPKIRARLRDFEKALSRKG
jgi:hypothetical protein